MTPWRHIPLHTAQIKINDVPVPCNRLFSMSLFRVIVNFHA
jgi:hypothetical protein